MQVVKRSGEREEFSRWKTINAMVKTGATRDEAEGILQALEPQLYEGITTEEIYHKVRNMLEGRKAARYSLKKALFYLGPEGENFETYLARLYQADGYETRTRQILQGRCVAHEVDVVMTRDGKRTMVECKFHNHLGIKCNIQVALYVHARYLDLQDSERLDRHILATNTKFSSDAERYARCVGMEVLGWNSPEGCGIEALAERHRIYPVTMLDIRRHDIDILLAHRIVVVSDLLERSNEVYQLLSTNVADKLLAQAREVLCKQ